MIQWFPGHMKKTLAEIKIHLKLVDIILIILDARIPISSMNLDLLKILNNKPVLILLNKMSLTDLNKNHLFENFFNNRDIETLLIDSKYKINIQKVFIKIKRLLSQKKYKYPTKTLKMMVVGVPNVGKSTFINCLAKRKATIVANKPSVTKKLQWINLPNNIKLLDTPGILYPKINYLQIAYSLGLCGCLKEEILPKEELVKYFLFYLKKYYCEKLKKNFFLNEIEIKEKDLLKTIIKKRYNEKIFFKNNYYDFIYQNNVIDKIFAEIRSLKISQVNLDLDLISLFKI
ncbi:ribosome biogenesis GTPase RsgA [Candidatus Phytoplasma oryzae]|uniref:Ribosome biogenesis GTPase A n=1 Tax=Candidatus Phytoplasma oryzae TaxID=203274 RepID=A0A328IL87_9MOLU|nr:ribosome biogenesis GTPase RsgA [Candidatus Phytoplasma oryzae]